MLSHQDREFGLSELAERSGVAYPSVHREIERAEAAGLVTSRRVGRTRLVRANPDSPFFDGLLDLLVKGFGAATVLGQALHDLDGIRRALIFGSWAAGFRGEQLARPVSDIDLLVLGSPDRSELYAAVSATEAKLGRQVQVTVRASDWFTHGSGAFHTNVTAGPIVELH